MTNPLPSDNRTCGSLFHTLEVLKISVQLLLLYSPRHLNLHNVFTEDTLCSICETYGSNLKNMEPHNLSDDHLEDAPEIGRSYL
jgi:hypothetical protein